jgi:hypothetical protein
VLSSNHQPHQVLNPMVGIWAECWDGAEVSWCKHTSVPCCFGDPMSQELTSVWLRSSYLNSEHGTWLIAGADKHCSFISIWEGIWLCLHLATRISQSLTYIPLLVQWRHGLSGEGSLGGRKNCFHPPKIHCWHYSALSVFNSHRIFVPIQLHLVVSDMLLSSRSCTQHLCFCHLYQENDSPCSYSFSFVFAVWG